jgi:hypothetical protein
MTQRVRRKFTSSTFCVDGYICKVFIEPVEKYTSNFYIWSAGFAIGKSKRQINDWYKRRKNKRARSLEGKISGKRGIKIIRKGFQEILKMRWLIEPGDALSGVCRSAKTEKEFNAFYRWAKKHPEIIINYLNKEFIWYRPPFPNDPVRKHFKIIPLTPSNKLISTTGSSYYDCFLVRPKVEGNSLSMEQITDLLSPVLATAPFEETPT